MTSLPARASIKTLMHKESLWSVVAKKGFSLFYHGVSSPHVNEGLCSLSKSSFGSILQTLRENSPRATLSSAGRLDG